MPYQGNALQQGNNSYQRIAPHQGNNSYQGKPPHQGSNSYQGNPPNQGNNSYQGNVPQQGNNPYQGSYQPTPQGYPQHQYSYNPNGLLNDSANKPKSKLAALLLAFFLGQFGAHNFYLGRTTPAIIQLLVCLFGLVTSVFIVGFVVLVPLWIWVIIEFILIATGADGFDRDSRGIPLL